MKHRLFSVLTVAAMAGSLLSGALMDQAQADHHGRGNHRYYGNAYRQGQWMPPGQAKKAYFNGYGYQPVSYYRDGVPFFQTKTGKIVKGGLVGAGIGAATAVVLDKPVLKTGLIGGAVGAGVQAVRYSNW